MIGYNEDVYADILHHTLNILTKVKEGLDYISKYEKLSRNEGQVKVIYGEEVGFEVYAPHLIPNGISQTWLADTFIEAYICCIKDLEQWIEIEKEAPRHMFGLDKLEEVE